MQNHAEYHLILIKHGCRPRQLNQRIFRMIEQDNYFTIQQILINYHIQNKKNLVLIYIFSQALSEAPNFSPGTN